MTVTRRKFLRAGAASALFAGLALRPSRLLFAQQKRRKPSEFDVPYEAKTDPVFYFEVSTFAPYVGSEFLLNARGRARGAAVRLEGVADSQKQMRARRLATHEGVCFMLHFSAPAPKREPQQGIYRVDHAALGTFSLFLVPGPARDGRITYEAVINRLA